MASEVHSRENKVAVTVTIYPSWLSEGLHHLHYLRQAWEEIRVLLIHVTDEEAEAHTDVPGGKCQWPWVCSVFLCTGPPAVLKVQGQRLLWAFRGMRSQETQIRSKLNVFQLLYHEANWPSATLPLSLSSQWERFALCWLFFNYCSPKITFYCTSNQEVKKFIKNEIGFRTSYLLIIFLTFPPQGLISIPAPCQYAHKLTFLVAQSIHKEPSLELANYLFYLWCSNHSHRQRKNLRSRWYTSLKSAKSSWLSLGKGFEFSFSFWGKNTQTS